MTKSKNTSFDDVDGAFWQWAKRNCPYPATESEKRFKWAEEITFPFISHTWDRTAIPLKSRTERKILGWSVSYRCEDGTILTNERPRRVII
jgi:hypothetical protein